MRCPYNEYEMSMSVNNIFNRLTEDESIIFVDEISELVSKYDILQCTSRSEYNKAVADFHGISVPSLVASPNMTTLIDDFWSYTVSGIVDEIVDSDNVRIRNNGIKLTKLDAWSIVYYSINNK